ncbi:unnamed protein product [Phyllotreta striolata]|uniref:SREBP regulating gene protein n=1 Tax=Phyllotreta striolata TaxID=444603 RepID=A0A9N9TXG8_PHYSR|nr:unnamed protein product [Phyllotreta striolata]
MWYSAFIRFIRRRIILGFIFLLSFSYCGLSYLKNAGLFNGNDDEVAAIKRTQPFVWRSLQQHNASDDDGCRNSVQGKLLIADDRGYLCPRAELLRNGCCNSLGPGVAQYDCDTCRPNNCCTIYEHCISCCLQPDKKEVLESVLGRASEQNNVLIASVADHFELCLAKCRTSSQSVRHENSYRDPEAKHCFGDVAAVNVDGEV